MLATPQNSTQNADTAVAPVLVLGLGNILLRDEGVGVRIVQALEHVALPADVEVRDGGTAGFDLIDLIAGRRRVIVIDALDGGHEPGTIVRLRPEDLVAGDQAGLSLHELGLMQALAMAQHLGEAPGDVVIFGVQPQDMSCGLELSPQIRACVPALIELVTQELTDAGGRQAGQCQPTSAVFSEVKKEVARK